MNIYLGLILYWNILYFIFIHVEQLVLHVFTKAKLGPKPNSFKSFSICQVSLLTACKNIYKFDLIFVYLRRT